MGEWRNHFLRFLLAILLLLAFPAPANADTETVTGSAGGRISLEAVAEFRSPWAMTFIDAETMLVTTKPGRLWLVGRDGEKTRIANVPEVFDGGQGGLGDVVPHPGFAANGLVYISFANSRDNGRTRFATVMRARLDRQNARLVEPEVIWEQQPAVSGRGHYAHRIAFAPDGSLFITSGDRQKITPAQDMESALGKLIRLNDDGSVPADNPFAGRGGIAKSFWSVGHRNALGIAFDGAGNLWAHEMGPRHGDELNLIERGANYGWPLVSEGNHYSGREIPPHETRPDLSAPAAFWVPTIAPSGLIFYDGGEFPQWQGDAFIGGLRSRALIRVAVDDAPGTATASEAERFEWGARIREVELAPDGAIWVLEDGSGGRLLRITR